MGVEAAGRCGGQRWDPGDDARGSCGGAACEPHGVETRVSTLPA